MSVESDQLRVPGARTSDEVLPDAGLRIGVLGQLVATREGTGLELGGPRQRAVLALLVLARGDVVPTDRMIDALWGDAAPPNATGALQAYVSHLRSGWSRTADARDAAERARARQAPGYALRVDPDAVDAWRFERLMRQAGQLLDDEPAAAQRAARRGAAACGADRPTPTTPASPGPRRRSRG